MTSTLVEPPSVDGPTGSSTEERPPRGLRSLAGTGAAWLAGLALLLLLTVPLLYLLRTSVKPGFFQPGTVTFENYQEMFRNDRLGTLLLNSAIYAAGVCLIAVTIGGGLAWVGERTNAPLRGLLLPIGLMPLAIPGVLFTLSGLLMFSPDTGIVNSLVQRWTPFDGILDIYSLRGMILVEGAQASPLAYLMIAGYLRSVDSSLEEAARVAGAGVRRTLRRITAPLGLPTLLGVLLLVFVRTIESFETPALIGIPARVPVFTSTIYLAIRDSPPNFGLASAYSTVLIAITSIGVFLYSRVLRRSGQFATISGKGSAQTRLDLGRWRWVVTGGVLAYASVVVVMPVAVLLYGSLLPSFASPSWEAVRRFNLDNYRTIVERPDFRSAVGNTAFLALSSAVLISIIALALAWLTVRSKRRGVWLIDSLASLPLVVPGIVMGMAFLTVALNVPVGLYGTMTVLVLLHVTRFLPYGMRTAAAGLVQIDAELEEAASIAGAGWIRRMRKVVLPLVLPTLFGGFLYATLLSVRELSGSIMVYTVDTRLFSILIFDYWQNGQLGLLSAASVMVIIVLLAFVYLLKRLGVVTGGAR
jgi:iron(III) transport system permease protein